VGRMNDAALAKHIAELSALAESIEAQLDEWREQMAALAHKYVAAASFLFWAAAFTTRLRAKAP